MLSACGKNTEAERCLILRGFDFHLRHIVAASKGHDGASMIRDYEVVFCGMHDWQLPCWGASCTNHE